MDTAFAVLLHWTTRAIEIAGVLVIVVGIIWATATYLHRRLAGDASSEGFRSYRSGVGRAILLGLEFLVAADIINTVAIDPTLQSLAVLGGIVLIRTFLSFSLEVEIEGRWPWQKTS
ncbi:DUF1622 domain-containing protein [Chelativorans sp. YIM 93263]|uniref:DUF1622 domain-containing protein n=1 Tax=Chelativorans sp. YIM 93263 TaxID=2906648 RepID=UPI002379E313|nr:DUF1622 domain-containing protein [Chelativorans sp. YIM 93263]